MTNKQTIITVGAFFLALAVGFLGAYVYFSLTSTTYRIELANGCTKQANGQVVNAGIVGPTLDVRVPNKYSSKFYSFALSHGVCLDKR